jgi:hypothetical protein
MNSLRTQILLHESSKAEALDKLILLRRLVIAFACTVCYKHESVTVYSYVPCH